MVDCKPRQTRYTSRVTAHKPSPLRIFAFSIASTLLILVGVLLGLGPQALFVTLVLAIIEITFSFDNAIINAKVLAKLPRFWQTMFLTLGIVVAIFGMRVLFPIMLVVLTAHLGWQDVVNLALHHPQEYAHHLEEAHPTIAAFGGSFLLLLGLSFFMDSNKTVHWLKPERAFRRLWYWVTGPLIALALLIVLALGPAHDHAAQIIRPGLLGAATYMAIQLLDMLFEKLHERSEQQHKGSKSTTLAALSSLLYLEVLDASFSFDGVIGAFAITSDIILIAAGLGIGALWVRSLTVYMVRHEFLGRYRYIEHGAHYTVLVLALVLLLSLGWQISDFIPGIIGLAIIGSSIYASLRVQRRETN